MILLFLPVVGFIGLLLLALVMPRRYKVKRSIIIHKPASDVMSKVGDLNYYAQWNPWQQIDPTTTSTITGTPNTIHHKYSWHGRKIGTGSLTINSIDDSHIHFDLEFQKPWKSHANDNWLFEKQSEGETKVDWQNSGDLRWPFARIMGPAINMMLNRKFEKGLNNLKQIVEKS
jgi:hypothetical protein